MAYASSNVSDVSMDDSPAEIVVHVAELRPPSGLLALTAPVLAIASAEGIVESPRSD